MASPQEFYNVRPDPGEKYGKGYSLLVAVTQFQNLLEAPKLLIRKFPAPGGRRNHT